MKKILSILLAVTMAAVLSATAVLAEDAFPQPEGGKKFENDWAIQGGLINIIYEEEGYRVLVDLHDGDVEDSGHLWEYSCYYHAEDDTLVSISSLKRSYAPDPATAQRILDEAEYMGTDDAGTQTVFSINRDGCLVWADSRGAGEGLAFRSIGRFAGAWRSAAGEEPVWAEIEWSDIDQNYSVYLHRGDEDTYAEFSMTGEYHPETGKLVCAGQNVDNDGEQYEAIFSLTADSQLLYEAANGILLEYDLLGGSNG